MNEKTPVPVWVLWALAGVALAIPLVLRWAGSNADAQVAWIVCGIVAAMLSFFAVLAHVHKHRTEAAVVGFARGEALVNWTYDADEWRSFARWKKLKVRRRMVWPPLIGAGVGALVGLGGESTARAVAVHAGWGLGAGCAMSLLLWFVSGRDEALLLGAKREVFIDHRGVMLADTFIPFGGLSGSVVRARVLPDAPAVLQLELETDLTLLESGRRAHRTVWVPVPNGSEAEARAVAEKLTGRPAGVPSAAGGAPGSAPRPSPARRGSR
jgi:hypothetical protein